MSFPPFTIISLEEIRDLSIIEEHFIVYFLVLILFDMLVVNGRVNHYLGNYVLFSEILHFFAHENISNLLYRKSSFMIILNILCI